VQSYVVTERPGGERVISERVESVRSVALGFWICAGSRDESDAQGGLTHFIEHLLFKGSRDYSAQEIAEIFDGLGGEINAATSRENTVVYARVPDTHLETALDVMADMVFSPRFSDLDSEREVVLEEIAMVEDAPQDLVHDFLSEAVFGRHPLGRPVIGTADVISTVSPEQIAAYHDAMYAGPRIVIASAGNVEHERLLAALERAERGRTGGDRQGDPNGRMPLLDELPPSIRFAAKDTEQFHVCLGAPGIARSDPRRFVLSLFDSILGGAASSRLFQEIREKRGMAYAVYSFTSQYTDTGLIGIYVGTRDDNVRACLEIVAAQIAEIAAGNLRPKELERAKENLKGRIVLSMESTSNRMSRLGKSLITDTEILTFEELLAEIDAVDAHAVAELAALLAPERISAAGIGPSEERFRKAVACVNPDLVASTSGGV